MDRVHVRRIAPPERRKLHRMKRQKRNRVNSDHARIILLSSGKVGNRQIAERVGCTPQWVRKIIHRFNRGGLEDIEWYPYFQVPRRPYKFTADLVEEIATVALSPPKTLIGMTHWSLPKLRDYLIEQKIIVSISLEWLRTLLRRAGVRWRRTRAQPVEHARRTGGYAAVCHSRFCSNSRCGCKRFTSAAQYESI